MSDILTLEDVVAGYEGVPVLKGVDLEVERDSIVGLIGRNGVGKTTTLRTIAGLLEAESGSVTFEGEEITGISSHQIYGKGIRLVPEDRGIFGNLTVRENLDVPIRGDGETFSIEELYEFFPQLENRQEAKGANLSGGEQQMLAIARALRSKPELLLLDEPSEGLAPQIVEELIGIIEKIAARGTTILLVEQNVDLTLDLSSHVYVMDAGEIIFPFIQQITKNMIIPKRNKNDLVC